MPKADAPTGQASFSSVRTSNLSLPCPHYGLAMPDRLVRFNIASGRLSPFLIKVTATGSFCNPKISTILFDISA